LTDSHVEMHDKVVLLGEESNLKSNKEVTIRDAKNRSLVFDYPELTRLVGVEREYLQANKPEAVAEFDEKWG
jgi:hypothetical protein